MSFYRLGLVVLLIGFFNGTCNAQKHGLNPKDVTSSLVCNLPENVIQEIKNYKSIVNQIFDTVLNGSFKGKTYEELERFIYKFGGRMTGTQNLEDSIDYVVNYWKQSNLNVYTEEAEVQVWVRGTEQAALTLPYHQKISIIGLGTSVSTPPGGITAEILSVKSFKELEENADKAKGKIVVFSPDWSSGSGSAQADYGKIVKYRTKGAVEAAKVGAVAALVRSIGPGSIYSPHTGIVNYDHNVTKIPTAAITIEDSDFLYNLQHKYGEKIELTLKMEDRTAKPTVSRNLFGEIKGKTNPEEIVLVSAHIDSWDNGQGVMDDGSGSWLTILAATLLDKLGIRPRRTLRFTLWTAEELGMDGVKSYVKRHKDELKNHKAVMEADSGTWSPLGLDFFGADESACVIQEIVKLLEPVKATNFRLLSLLEVGSDITHLSKEGIPSVSLYNNNTMYFWYHHTQGDTMNLVNTADLDKNLGLWAAVSYVIADMPTELKKRN